MQAIDLVANLVIYYVVTSSAMLRIMVNPSATLESILATSELTSSSTLAGDVEDRDELINDLRINIGDLRIDLIVDLLLACRSACYLTKQCNLTCAEQ